MKICLFYHSVISDWNHGNAHFLRGIASSLMAGGHDVRIFEPSHGWSLSNLISEKGMRAVRDFRKFFPYLKPEMYNEDNFNPADYLEDADVVLVHEWNNPEVVRRIGSFRRMKGDLVLLFHDTHHRSVSVPEEMEKYDLSAYDGVLAFGDVIRRIYLQKGWADKVWTWHEAADDRIFHPVVSEEKRGDLVWIGNWGDEERTEELMEFIINPVKELGLEATFYGVRYPAYAMKLLKQAKIKYEGWLPNYRVPEVFSKYSVTVHVPRKPYVTHIPGIPTIRPFEAMACGIPLLCSPWNDSECLFTPGKDYLSASDGAEMKSHLYNILNDKQLAINLSAHGLETIRNRHTCDHRVNELYDIIEEIRADQRVEIKSYDYE